MQNSFHSRLPMRLKLSSLAVLVPRPHVRFLSLRLTERWRVTSTNRRMPVTNDVCTAGGHGSWLSRLVTNLPTTRPPSPFRATYTSWNNMQFLIHRNRCPAGTEKYIPCYLSRQCYKGATETFWSIYST